MNSLTLICWDTDRFWEIHKSNGSRVSTFANDKIMNTDISFFSSQTDLDIISFTIRKKLSSFQTLYYAQKFGSDKVPAVNKKDAYLIQSEWELSCFWCDFCCLSEFFFIKFELKERFYFRQFDYYAQLASLHIAHIEDSFQSYS